VRRLMEASWARVSSMDLVQGELKYIILDAQNTDKV
jgi:hypothetical protein